MTETPNPYGSPPSEPSGQPSPPSSPYGQQPPSNPYGQPPSNPYGQQPPSNPYGDGQQPAGTPYGQPGYGAPQFGDPDKRPGTVLAAGITTVVLSLLTALGVLVGLFGFLVARDEVEDVLDDEIGGDLIDSGVTVNDITVILIAVMVVFLIWCVIAAILGVLAMRRQNWARITLVVSASMTALVSLIGITSLLSAVTLIGAIAVIVLLFTGGASHWYAAKGSGSQQYPQQPDQPWGQAPSA